MYYIVKLIARNNENKIYYITTGGEYTTYTAQQCYATKFELLSDAQKHARDDDSYWLCYVETIQETLQEEHTRKLRKNECITSSN